MFCMPLLIRTFTLENPSVWGLGVWDFFVVLGMGHGALYMLGKPSKALYLSLPSSWDQRFVLLHFGFNSTLNPLSLHIALGTTDSH